MTTNTAQRFREAGFSLVEVMVAMLVVAIGLLGSAAMTNYTIKSSKVTQQRALATYHAYNIIDCMRANRLAALNGEYTLADFGDVVAVTTIAADDINAWQQELGSNLPEGAGKITFTGSALTVEIRWKEAITVDENDEWKIFRTETTL